MMAFSNRSRLQRAFILGFTLLAAACQTRPTVTTDTAPDAKVEDYRTFGFVEPPGTDTGGYTTLTTRYLKEAVTREMAARGYQHSSDPELLINFEAGIGDGGGRKAGSGVSVGMGTGSGGFGRSTSVGVGVGVGSRVGGNGAESTLRIDVVDRQRKQMVWGGTIVERMPTGQKEYSQAMIDKSVASIFAKYPKQPSPTANTSADRPST